MRRNQDIYVVEVESSRCGTSTRAYRKLEDAQAEVAKQLAEENDEAYGLIAFMRTQPGFRESIFQYDGKCDAEYEYWLEDDESEDAEYCEDDAHNGDECMSDDSEDFEVEDGECEDCECYFRISLTEVPLY